MNITQQDYSPYHLPPLILLPFIENAFKHGAELNPEKVDIQIFLGVQNNRLFLEVINAFALDKIKQRNGTGLVNISKRLSLIYKDNYTLELKEQNQRFIVKLSIPL